MASVQDFKVASMAAGFSLGFGFLTTWEVVKQTRRNRNPWRSAYIYMIWGEIVANLGLGILGYLFLNDVISASIPLFFFILFFWVFETQLLMQIIINRISIIVESPHTAQRLKWGTACVMTSINVAVFCIFIPSHVSPPVSPLFVTINSYWDRTSKILILAIDAVLNWYFLRTVKKRLVSQHGLRKYEPLVTFNARLMVLSVSMDVLLIGLMSLPNPTVFIQFHPVVYLVKLNIEMSMASLISRLARKGLSSDVFSSTCHSDRRPPHHDEDDLESRASHHERCPDPPIEMSHRTQAILLDSDEEPSHLEISKRGIQRRTELKVEIEEFHHGGPDRSTPHRSSTEDEFSLTRNTGYPKANNMG